MDTTVPLLLRIRSLSALWLLLLLSPAALASYSIGVGRADSTGPVAEIVFVSIDHLFEVYIIICISEWRTARAVGGLLKVIDVQCSTEIFYNETFLWEESNEYWNKDYLVYLCLYRRIDNYSFHSLFAVVEN